MSDEYAVQRAKAKAAAIERAEFNLRTALARIDWHYDRVIPAKKQIELDATVGELPEFTIADN